jgi:hypothetical protein
MSEAESERAIEQALQAFATQPLKAAATGLFIALGYASKKTLDLRPNGLRCLAPYETRACAPSLRQRRSHANWRTIADP